jgi:hypothetical protein
MIRFEKVNGILVLKYEPEQSGNAWVYRDLKEEDTITIRGTFHLTPEHLYGESAQRLSKDKKNGNWEDDSGDEPVDFKVAVLRGEYFVFDRRILGLGCDLLIHKDVKLTHRSFTAEKNVSIFRKIAELRPGRIVIGGAEPDSLPEKVFDDLINRFPNTHELKRYVSARVSAAVRDFFETQVDGEKLYRRYMNRRLEPKARDIAGIFREQEIRKYQFLHEKLTDMLRNEESYSEAKWQAEILQIILLLYPKYIRAFEKAPVRDTYNNKRRELDILLVAASGNVDIAEIKQPFGKCIVTSSQYRDNYIPLRELSGTVMQIEKYIYYFNKWGRAGEDYLTKKYKSELPEGFRIKITNPGAIIIMGRDENLTEAQLQDFEVVRRKYKSVIDIITYDDLLRRLNFTIEQLRVKAQDKSPGRSGDKAKNRHR